VLYGVDVRDRESGGARDYAGRRGDSRRKAYADHARNSGRSAPRCYCRAHSRHPSPLPSAAGDRPDCTDVPTSLRECTVGSYSDVDTEVYSNTGGQKSKSTRSGATAKFASNGKNGQKKDLARMAMVYDDVYVAHVSLGANMQQTIKALTEAEKHNGPSIIIAYAPCITHGIKSGMKDSIKEEKLAVESGYWPLFRYSSEDDKLYLDYKNPNFDKYEEFLNNENRYAMTKLVNEEKAKELFDLNKESAKKRFEYYKRLSEEVSVKSFGDF